MERLQMRGPRALWIDRVPRVGAALCLALAGCDDGATGDTAAITQVRTAPQVAAAPAPGMTLRERIGMTRESAPAVAPAAPRFTYDLPAGWKALPPMKFREVNLQHAEVEATLLTVTAFDDRAGDRPNLDRWRGQMGHPALTDEEFADLETRTILGAPALLIEMRGPYRGMSETAEVEEAQFYGAVGRVEGQSLFVKMVVPVDMATEARATFDFFLDSLQAAEPAAALPAGHPPTGGAAPSGAPAAAGNSTLTWTTPAGWSEIPPKNQFREITFQNGEVEMYISRARGDLTMNVNRWAGQLGSGPLGADELAALPRVPSLGSEAVVFEGAGTLAQMQGPTRTGQRMVAAFIPLPDGSGEVVTVKMTGPDADVVSARSTFMDLLGTLGQRR